MEEKELRLNEQFCDDIESAARTSCVFILMEIQNVLELYDNDIQKLEFLESQRIKVREKLKGSTYIKMFSSDAIIADLTIGLRFYFKLENMSDATTVECSETLQLGQHEYNPETGKLVVPYDPWYAETETDFNFAEFHHFKPLKEYIQFSMLFIELRKLEVEFKRKQIVDPNIELPQIGNKVDVVLMTGNDKNGKEILGQPRTTIDLLKGNEAEKRYLLDYLIKNFSNKRGKSIAIMILALDKAEKIKYLNRKELYLALRSDFGNIGTDSGINKYIMVEKLMDEEYKKTISIYAEEIKNLIDK
ncbi:MAG TPA: hypothetical protein VGK10_21245 [Prolixibacteraceae bacterium]|jgi:hypothetical protein